MVRPVNIELKEGDYDQILSTATELNVAEVVTSEILKYKISVLNQNDEKFLADCFWILQNIASGRSDQPWAVITAGAVSFAVKIIQQCPLISLVTQCIMLLGNIIEKHLGTLNYLIQSGICDKMYARFDSVDTHRKGQIVSFYMGIIKWKHAGIPEDTLSKISNLI